MEFPCVLILGGSEEIIIPYKLCYRLPVILGIIAPPKNNTNQRKTVK